MARWGASSVASVGRRESSIRPVSRSQSQPPTGARRARRRAFGRQRARPRRAAAALAVHSAATFRAPPRPGCHCPWRRPRLHRLPAGGASRHDRTPTGHALVRSVAGPHPLSMARDPASVAAPPAAGHPSALAAIAIRLSPPSQLAHAVSRRPGVRPGRPAETNGSPLRLPCRRADRCAVCYGNWCALRCIWRRTPSPREFRPFDGPLLKGGTAPGRPAPPISRGTHGRT